MLHATGLTHTQEHNVQVEERADQCGETEDSTGEREEEEVRGATLREQSTKHSQHM